MFGLWKDGTQTDSLRRSAHVFDHELVSKLPSCIRAAAAHATRMLWRVVESRGASLNQNRRSGESQDGVW
jgi:hypothetical protein